jgi:VCBS repeat-containing protein
MNVASGFSLPYSVSGISAADIMGGVLTGTATVDAAGKTTITVPVAADKRTEGDETLTVTVQGQAASVTIKDTSVNTMPVAANATVRTNEDTPLTATLPAATDTDGDPVIYTKATHPSNGRAVVTAGGSYTYIPTPNYNGPDSFTYTVSDGQGGSNIYTVSLTVNAVNDAPVATGGSLSITEDTLAAGTLSATDVDNASLSYALVTQSANGNVTLGANGNYIYTPGANFNGSDSFTFKANDGSADSNTATVTITVVAVNDTPTGTSTVTITGTPTQGQTLFAANTLADADGIPTSGAGAVSYQWRADGVAISGATGSTLNLTQSLVGKALSVRASYTDNFGQAESVTSSATSVVANVNDAPTGAVSISGNASLRHSLSATNTLADVDGIPGSGAGAISYQWRANGSPISGATGSTFSPTPTQIGKVITVTASYTDLGGAVESITSPATEPIRGFRDFWHDAVTRGMERPNPQTLPFGQDLLMADTSYSTDLARLFGVPLEFGA